MPDTGNEATLAVSGLSHLSGGNVNPSTGTGLTNSELQKANDNLFNYDTYSPADDRRLTENSEK